MDPCDSTEAAFENRTRQDVSRPSTPPNADTSQSSTQSSSLQTVDAGGSLLDLSPDDDYENEIYENGRWLDGGQTSTLQPRGTRQMSSFSEQATDRALPPLPPATLPNDGYEIPKDKNGQRPDDSKASTLQGRGTRQMSSFSGQATDRALPPLPPATLPKDDYEAIEENRLWPDGSQAPTFHPGGIMESKTFSPEAASKAAVPPPPSLAALPKEDYEICIPLETAPATSKHANSHILPDVQLPTRLEPQPSFCHKMCCSTLTWAVCSVVLNCIIIILIILSWMRHSEWAYNLPRP